jgi:hypothetical protein
LCRRTQSSVAQLCISADYMFVLTTGCCTVNNWDSAVVDELTSTSPETAPYDAITAATASLKGSECTPTTTAAAAAETEQGSTESGIATEKLPSSSSTALPAKAIVVAASAEPAVAEDDYDDLHTADATDAELAANAVDMGSGDNEGY